MKELKIISAVCLIGFFVSGCYYDVEEELYPTIDCVTTDMSYSADIVPILETNCYTCHSAAANFGNVTLEGHDELLKYVDDGSFLGTVRHDGGFSPMPKGKAKLLECEIEKIAAWIDDGAMDN